MDSHLLQKMVGQTLALAEEESEEELPCDPAVPRVLFDVEVGKGTFCLKGRACSGEQDGAEREFFATSRVELAEVIVDQLFHRRFPLAEDALCNISDPGSSWWMTQQEARLDIFWGGHYSEEEKLNLGPVGDAAVAYAFFKKGESHLRRLLPLEELSLSEKGLSLSVLDPRHAIYQQFCDIFAQGEEPVHPSFGTSSLSLYFEELAVVRRFWIYFQESVLSEYCRDC